MPPPHLARIFEKDEVLFVYRPPTCKHANDMLSSPHGTAGDGDDRKDEEGTRRKGRPF